MKFVCERAMLRSDIGLLARVVLEVVHPLITRVDVEDVLKAAVGEAELVVGLEGEKIGSIRMIVAEQAGALPVVGWEDAEEMRDRGVDVDMTCGAIVALGA